MSILFIQTGGTIDKAYPRGETHHGYNFEIGAPAVRDILREVDPRAEYSFLEILRKDSLDITDEDRIRIVEAVSDALEHRIVVTHGTDTMHITAEAIAQRKLSKTIVLTGSNLPFAFKQSDAGFNVGMAVAGAQVLPHGVYIALNGLLQPWNEYHKQ